MIRAPTSRVWKQAERPDLGPSMRPDPDAKETDGAPLPKLT